MEFERMAAENAEARRDLERMAMELAKVMEAQKNRTPEEAEEMKLNLERLNYPRNWMLAPLCPAQCRSADRTLQGATPSTPIHASSKGVIVTTIRQLL
jgi:hypothetical protein